MRNIPKTSGIYAIQHKESGKLYVGSSVNMQKRLREHFRLLNLWKHANQHLQAAWNKFGESAFECRVIEMVACIDDLYAAEQVHLDALNAYDGAHGYNKAKSTTAPQRGLKRSAETCAKIGASKIGNKNRLGAEITAEMRERIAKKLRGTKASDATRAKLSAAKKGVSHSPEWSAKIGATHKGKVIPQEMRDRISATLKKRYPQKSPKEPNKIGRPVGIPMTDEAKERLRIANSGKTLSAEHRAKIGAANKARFEMKQQFKGELA